MSQKIKILLLIILVVVLFGFGYKFYGTYQKNKIIETWTTLPNKSTARQAVNVYSSSDSQLCVNRGDGYDIFVPRNYSDQSNKLGGVCSLYYLENTSGRFVLTVLSGREYLKLNQLSFNDYFSSKEFRQYQLDVVGDSLIKMYWLKGKNNDYLVEIVENKKDKAFHIYAYTEDKSKNTFRVNLSLQHSPTSAEIDEFYTIINSMVYYK